jgi:hypothetical protein
MSVQRRVSRRLVSLWILGGELVIGVGRSEEFLHEGDRTDSFVSSIGDLLKRSSDSLREEVSKGEGVAGVSIVLGKFIPHEVSEIDP